MRQVTDAKDLKKYLDDSRQVIRIAAIKRTAEIGDPDSVDMLYEYYRREPAAGRGEVEAEIILALGKIHAEKSRRILVELLKETLLRKPVFHVYLYANDEAKCFRILSNLVASLGKWDDEEVKQELLKISKDLSFPYTLRGSAYKQVLGIEMKRLKYLSPAEQIPYLISLVNNKEDEWVAKFKDKNTPEALQAMQTKVAIEMLRRYDSSFLQIMEKCYNQMPENRIEERKEINKVMKYIEVDVDIKRNDGHRGDTENTSWLCPVCGNLNYKYHEYCDYCGRRVGRKNVEK
jgi:rubrerythrin